MAAPAAILAEQLAAARRAGESFEVAWPDALAAAIEVVPVKSERNEWARVFDGTVQTWREAFERVPAGKHERALSLLTDGSDREPSPDRECARCGEEIPDDRDRRAFYCSDRCRRDASYARTHAAA